MVTCNLFPTEAVERAAGVSLGEPMIPTGFDPNPLGGQIGCVWTDVPGWSAQITPGGSDVMPPPDTYAVMCRFMTAAAVVGTSRWVACVGTNPEGQGYLFVTTKRATYLVTTAPLDVATLKQVARAIGENG